MKKKNLLYRFTLWVSPWLYGLLSRLLFATCRVENPDRDFYTRMIKGPPCVFTFWHYSIFYVVHLSRGSRWVPMVSASADGEYVARILEGLGYRVVRGSRGRGGVRALRQMLKLIGDDGNGAVVADGSQGPPLEVQGGVILMAAHLGVPVVPIVWAADRYWTFSSWDRTVLPKPFSRILVRCGKPFTVPKEAGREEFEQYRQRLEKEMLDLYREAWAAVGREGH